MSENDDFPYLEEERRSYRRKVAFSIVGVLLAVGVFVLRWSARQERERDLENSMALSRAMSDMPPPDLTSYPPATAEPDRPPIELALVVGARRFDIAGEPIALGDGRKIVIHPRELQTHVGEALSFVHPSSMHVIDAAGSIMITGEDSSAELALVESTATDAADLAELGLAYTESGQVISDKPTKHALLGRAVAGRRLVAANLAIELLTAKVDKTHRLRAIVTGTSPGADLAPMFTVLESVTTKPPKRTPELDLSLVDGAGHDVEIAPVTIGEHVIIGPDKLDLVVERRATVRQRLSGITFEHSPELSALPLDVALPAVQLRSGELGLQLMTTPIAMTGEDLLSSMSASGAALTDQKPVTRTFGGASYTGVGGDLALGAIALHTEVFPFKRGGRDYIATLQYPRTAEAKALALLGPVIASVE